MPADVARFGLCSENDNVPHQLAIGLPLPGYALLEMKGRKTGKPRRTPVDDGRVGYEFWLVAEHGMRAGYVRNIGPILMYV